MTSTENLTSGELTLSVVVPVFNEHESIVEFCRQLRQCLDGLAVSYEVIFVNDGSSDSSQELIEAEGWANARVVSFIANAGHMAALDAGYRQSQGRYVVSLDSDLQHPPALIAPMLETAEREGVDVVYAARKTRARDSWFKRNSALLYYRLMRGLTEVELQDSAADFRLISDRVVRVIKALPPGRQVFRLLIPSLGFPSRTVHYTAASRIAGESKYTFKKMISLSTDSVVGFTTIPLTISIRIGLVVSLFAVAGFVYVLVTYFSGHALEGWASVLSTLLLLFGLLFVVLGVFGMYMGAILRALSARPLYILDESTTVSSANVVVGADIQPVLGDDAS